MACCSCWRRGRQTSGEMAAECGVRPGQVVPLAGPGASTAAAPLMPPAPSAPWWSSLSRRCCICFKRRTLTPGESGVGAGHEASPEEGGASPLPPDTAAVYTDLEEDMPLVAGGVRRRSSMSDWGEQGLAGVPLVTETNISIDDISSGELEILGMQARDCKTSKVPLGMPTVSTISFSSSASGDGSSDKCKRALSATFLPGGVAKDQPARMQKKIFGLTGIGMERMAGGEDEEGVAEVVERPVPRCSRETCVTGEEWIGGMASSSSRFTGSSSNTGAEDAMNPLAESDEATPGAGTPPEGVVESTSSSRSLM